MSTYYRFALLDPRPIPAAAEANEAVFASGPVLGVEVTVPALAGRCSLGNIDPQHTDGDTSRAAVEAIIDRFVVSGEDFPERQTVLATVRADLDAVGAMAILEIAQWESCSQTVDTGIVPAVDQVFSADALERIALIASADKFARGAWPGQRPLPTTENPWPKEAEGSVDSTRSIAAIAAAVADFRIPLDQRVEWMMRWLTSGEEPESYRTKVEAERAEMIRALETSEISISLAAGDRIAVVESTHRAATAVGYAHAPVVVALNPAFRLGQGEPHRKFTVCAYTAQVADIRGALAELAALEPGWGGSPTIGGSPQGVPSTLTIEEVVGVVQKYLK